MTTEKLLSISKGERLFDCEVDWDRELLDVYFDDYSSVNSIKITDTHYITRRIELFQYYLDRYVDFDSIEF